MQVKTSLIIPIFLVGNPFMAHLDMTKFFAQNNGLEPKYWIVKDNEQAINIAAGTKEWIGTTSSVAPLQSFFVKAKQQIPKNSK